MLEAWLKKVNTDPQQRFGTITPDGRFIYDPDNHPEGDIEKRTVRQAMYSVMGKSVVVYDLGGLGLTWHQSPVDTPELLGDAFLLPPYLRPVSFIQVGNPAPVKRPEPDNRADRKNVILNSITDDDNRPRIWEAVNRIYELEQELQALKTGREPCYEKQPCLEIIRWRPLVESPTHLKTVLLSFADGAVDTGEWDGEEGYWQWGVDEFKTGPDGGGDILAWAEMPKGVVNCKAALIDEVKALDAGAPYRGEVDGNMRIRSDEKGQFFVLMADGSWKSAESVKEDKPNEYPHARATEDTAMFLAALPVNPRPFIQSLKGYLLSDGGQITDDKARRILHTLVVIVCGQLHRVELHTASARSLRTLLDALEVDPHNQTAVEHLLAHAWPATATYAAWDSYRELEERFNLEQSK